ncbi:MAG: hypothetical protein FWD36_04595 [Treponema sp.]|nr:hypothetical protein [Treponema sp.]
MKKLYIAAAIVLVITMAACNNFAPDPLPDEGPRTMEVNGQTFVKLGIGFSDNSRALFDTMAIAATEWYEVAFFDGTNYFRTAWPDGERGYLWVPVDVNYSGNALIFAGTASRTLLATGRITNIDTTATAIGPTDPAIITGTSRLVTFTLTPLTNNIYGATTPGTSNPATSTFRVTSASPAAGTDITGSIGSFPTVTINTHPYPVYRLGNAATIQATYAIGNIPAGLILAGPSKVIPKILTEHGYYQALDVSGVFTNPPAPTGPIPNPAIPSTPFEITLTTGANAGLLRLSIEVPVFALSVTEQVAGNSTTGTSGVILNEFRPRIWYIRGGISNLSLDMGVAAGSDGGAVLLGVGDYQFQDQSIPGYIEITTQ